jgi:hypothetical protein
VMNRRLKNCADSLCSRVSSLGSPLTLLDSAYFDCLLSRTIGIL